MKTTEQELQEAGWFTVAHGQFIIISRKVSETKAQHGVISPTNWETPSKVTEHTIINGQRTSETVPFVF